MSMAYSVSNVTFDTLMLQKFYILHCDGTRICRQHVKGWKRTNGATTAGHGFKFEMDG